MSADNIPIAITGTSAGGGGPSLQEPASETVSSGGSVAVAGSYSDSYAANNPGAMYLGISTDSGTLSAVDASGNAVAGSGTGHIALSTDYVDVNAILANLQYTAGTTSGSDTIHFDLWNQQGVETTGATAMTIDPSGDAQPMMASLLDFPAGPGGGSQTLSPWNVTGGSILPGQSIDAQQMVIPPVTHS